MLYEEPNLDFVNAQPFITSLCFVLISYEKKKDD